MTDQRTDGTFGQLGAPVGGPMTRFERYLQAKLASQAPAPVRPTSTVSAGMDTVPMQVIEPPESQSQQPPPQPLQ